jgi:hypothetical protein
MLDDVFVTNEKDTECSQFVSIVLPSRYRLL